METLDKYIYEKLKINKDSVKPVENNKNYIIGTFLMFKSDFDIIDFVIDDFTKKSVKLLHNFYNLGSIKTYDIFYKEYGTKTVNDYITRGGFKEIYSDIPSQDCLDLLVTYDHKMKQSEFEDMFGKGEFPCIKIYKRGDGVFFYTLSR